MALSEVQQRDIFVKIVFVMLVCLLAYGVLSLMGIVR